MGLADEKREPWYNHQEQAKAIDLRNALRNAVQQALRQAARQRAYAKADSWSGHGIDRIAGVNYAMGHQPDRSRYKSGEPHMAVRTPDDRGTFEQNGKFVNLTDWTIQVFDKNGPLAGAQVSETNIEHLAQKDIGTSQEQKYWTQKTNQYGFVPNYDHWKQSFTSRSGFDTIRQTLTSGSNTLQWTATQSPLGVDVYTHQTGYFLQPGY